MLKTKNGITMLSTKGSVCSSKKSRFLKEQEGKGLLSSLGIKTPLSRQNIALVGISRQNSISRQIFH